MQETGVRVWAGVKDLRVSSQAEGAGSPGNGVLAASAQGFLQVRHWPQATCPAGRTPRGARPRPVLLGRLPDTQRK